MMMLQQTGKRPDPEPTAAFRQPPHNIQLEQALLGAVLMNNAVTDRLDGLVEPEDFFDPLHGEIYRTAVAMARGGKQANPITLRTFFENAEPLAPDMTVPQYLGKLVAAATTIINAPDYAKAIHALAVRRRLIVVGEDIVNTAYDAPHDFGPEDQIEAAEKELTALAEHGQQSTHVSTFSDALARAVAEAEMAHKRGDGMHGLSTGLADIDRALGGLAKGKLYILAGRPSMGKTALVTNIAAHVASHGHPVAFFSLEMGDDEIALRIAAAQAGVSASKFTRGQASDSDMRALVEFSARARYPLHFDTRGGISIGQLAARARRQFRQHRIELLIVDYLQLMRGSGGRGENRVQEITEITSGLKALAKELEVPIIALSQLSRQVEQREDKRPQLSDLRESGSIEQDADVVMFVFREEYYVERRKPSEGDPKFFEWQKDMARVRGKAEVIVAKNRSGRVGTVEVAFRPDLTQFANLARNDQAERLP